MYEKALEHAGLTIKQAKIYLAALELGHASANDIARSAGVKRTTAYGIIDELVEMGLLSVSNKGRLKTFNAQDPHVVEGILNDRKREIESVLPYLLSLHASHHLRPRVQFYEGAEGIKQIYEDTLSCQSKKILQIVRVQDFITFPGGEFSQDYIRRRAEKGIVAYALHPASGDVHNQIYGRHSDRWKRHVRYLPPSFFYASMLMIYDHKVMMISTKKENFGFIIESKEFSNTLRAMFEFLWNVGSKEPQV